MIENRHLRYFLEVARTLHITRAAERLHIAQPALTQNIQQLEQELGVALFERKGRRLSLTEAGRVFEREAEHSLQIFQGAQLAAQRAVRGEVGRVVLGFQNTAGLTLIPQLLKQLAQRYPEIEVVPREMGSRAQRKALRQGEIDAGVMYALPDDEFEHQELKPDGLIVVVPEMHALAARESIMLEDLAEERFILPSPETAEVLHYAVLAACADAGFQPKHVQDIATAPTALGLVSAGFGISILPAAVGVLSRRGVVMLPLDGQRLKARLALVWPTKHASPIIPKLLECLLS